MTPTNAQLIKNAYFSSYFLFKSRIEELEEQVQSEKIYRTKLERQKCAMEIELEEISIRLEDSSTAMIAQVELNKRKDLELNRYASKSF